MVSGLEIGYGGVYVGAAPYLLHIPLDAETDRPAGDPVILADGWGYQDTHETLNWLALWMSWRFYAFGGEGVHAQGPGRAAHSAELRVLAVSSGEKLL